MGFAMVRGRNGECMKMEMCLLMLIYINEEFKCLPIYGRRLYGAIIKHSPVGHGLGYFAFRKYDS